MINELIKFLRILKLAHLSQYQPAPAQSLGDFLFNLWQSSWHYVKNYKGLKWRLLQTVLKPVGFVLSKRSK